VSVQSPATDINQTVTVGDADPIIDGQRKEPTPPPASRVTAAVPSCDLGSRHAAEPDAAMISIPALSLPGGFSVPDAALNDAV
jgi:hypothetical protein